MRVHPLFISLHSPSAAKNTPLSTTIWGHNQVQACHQDVTTWCPVQNLQHQSKGKMSPWICEWITLPSATPGLPEYLRRLSGAQHCPLSTDSCTMYDLPHADKYHEWCTNNGTWQMSRFPTTACFWKAPKLSSHCKSFLHYKHKDHAGITKCHLTAKPLLV